MIELTIDAGQVQIMLQGIADRIQRPPKRAMEALAFGVAERCRRNIDEGIGTAPPSLRVRKYRELGTGRPGVTLRDTSNMYNHIKPLSVGEAKIDVGVQGIGSDYVMHHLEGDPGGKPITVQVKQHRRKTKSGGTAIVKAHSRNTHTPPCPVRDFRLNERNNPGYTRLLVQSTLEKAVALGEA